MDPPPYYLSDGPISPPYSLQPAEAEIPLSLTPSTATWHYHTKHMKINLETGRWGLQYPCYGLNGNVKGSMSFSGSPNSIERVTISLEVLVSTSRSGSVSPVLSRALLLHEIGTKDSSEWTGDHPFSIRIPTEIALEGNAAIPTPPSCSSLSFAASCQTSFSIKICMYRTGKSWKRTEVKVIPILYLPKSSPKSPPLTYIPRPSTHEFADMSTACLHLFERVHTTALQPFWPSSCKQSKLLLFDRAVNFSIPAPKSYTSGDAIPYTISLVFSDRPFMPMLLFPCISVVLHKRITIWAHRRRKKDLRVAYTRDWPIATGQFKYQNVYKEGLVLYRGSIDAGKASEECSWRLDDVVEVEFFLRATVIPPRYIQEYVPSFMHEEVIELTTDHYGALSRELTATGEIPPALGLMKASEPVESRLSSGCPAILCNTQHQFVRVMILDEKSMFPPPPPYDEIVQRAPATPHSDLGPVSLATLPSHVLLQIVYSTFPETDGQFEGQSKVVMQREALFWLETSLRLVNRSLYIISMYILRSTYLPAYLSLVKPPYTSDLAAADNPEGSVLLETGNREVRTLDLFIALLAHEDFMLDSTCLHLPREEAYKDVFDFMQPRSRLEDLIFREGVPMGLVAADDADGDPGPSAQRHPNPPSPTTSSAPPTPTTPTMPAWSSFNPLTVVSAYREKKKMKKIPPPTPFISERPAEPIKPIPFSALSVSLSPRTVKALCTDGRWKKVLVQVDRSKDESLEAIARRLLSKLREAMEMGSLYNQPLI